MTAMKGSGNKGMRITQLEILDTGLDLLDGLERAAGNTEHSAQCYPHLSGIYGTRQHLCSIPTLLKHTLVQSHNITCHGCGRISKMNKISSNTFPGGW